MRPRLWVAIENFRLSYCFCSNPSPPSVNLLFPRTHPLFFRSCSRSLSFQSLAYLVQPCATPLVASENWKGKRVWAPLSLRYDVAL